MPEVRIGPYLSARDTVPRGSDCRWPHLMTGTDSASGWYISRVRDWLDLALQAKATGCPLLLQLRTSWLERTAVHPFPDVCDDIG